MLAIYGYANKYNHQQPTVYRHITFLPNTAHEMVTVQKCAKNVRHDKNAQFTLLLLWFISLILGLVIMESVHAMFVLTATVFLCLQFD